MSKEVKYKETGEQLRLFINAMGLTQAQLGEKIGLSKVHINSIVNGRHRLTQETIDKIESVFQIDWAYWNDPGPKHLHTNEIPEDAFDDYENDEDEYIECETEDFYNVTLVFKSGIEQTLKGVSLEDVEAIKKKFKRGKKTFMGNRLYGILLDALYINMKEVACIEVSLDVILPEALRDE